MGWTFYDSDGRQLIAQGGTADVATGVTASANNSTDETVYPTFVDGATGTQGIETDTGLTYNPSTGVLTSTQFTGAVAGNVTGNVTGNASGTAATVTGGTQASITSAANLVTVGTIGTGVWQGTVVAAGYLPDASPTAQGVVELAIGTEVTTGTSTSLAISPDGLAASVVFGTRYVQCIVNDAGADIAEGNGKFYIHIPAGLNGMDLVEAHAKVITVGSGSTVDIMIHNLTDTTDMLSTSLTIDNGGLDSKDASAAVAINASEDDVVTNDVIRLDVDGNGGDSTIAKGLIVTLGFRLP
jgi:hypothetical protein